MTMLPGMTSIDVAEVVELTRQLVRIDTSNPPGNEEEAIRHLGSYLSDFGIEVQYQEVEPRRPNLLARLKGKGDSGHLVFSGHMDVVPQGHVPWDHDPFAADLVHNRIIGRGAADMKGGVAAMAVAMTTLVRHGFEPVADVILAASVGEEYLGPGARHMVTTEALANSRFLVIGEPTGLDVCIAQKGGTGWEVTVHGIAAHSSTPHLGASAVNYAARAILALEACPFPSTPHALLGEPTVTVTNVHSAGARNVVPDTCTFIVSVRMVPGMDAAELDRQTRALLADLAREGGGQIWTETERRLSAPALETPRDHPLVEAVVEAVTAATGSVPVVKGFTGGTEAAILAPAFNLPFVICGPGKLEVAHQVNEWVDIAELQAAAEAYTLIAQRLLSSGAAE